MASGTHIKWKACRSSGPGGQNVNKTNSRAELIISKSFFPIELKERMTIVRVESQVHRHFIQNQEECKKKVLEMMRRVVEELVPRETSLEKIERIEGLKKMYQRKRLEDKKYQKAKKMSRSMAKVYRCD